MFPSKLSAERPHRNPSELTEFVSDPPIFVIHIISCTVVLLRPPKHSLWRICWQYVLLVLSHLYGLGAGSHQDLQCFVPASDLILGRVNCRGAEQSACRLQLEDMQFLPTLSLGPGVSGDPPSHRSGKLEYGLLLKGVSSDMFYLLGHWLGQAHVN